MQAAEAKYSPGAKVKTGADALTAGLLGISTRSGRQKIMQYISGKAAYDKIKAQPELVDAIFSKPAYADILLRTRGEVLVSVPHTASAEKREAFIQNVTALRGVTPAIRST